MVNSRGDSCSRTLPGDRQQRITVVHFKLEKYRTRPGTMTRKSHCRTEARHVTCLYRPVGNVQLAEVKSENIGWKSL